MPKTIVLLLDGKLNTQDQPLPSHVEALKTLLGDSTMNCRLWEQDLDQGWEMHQYLLDNEVRLISYYDEGKGILAIEENDTPPSAHGWTVNPPRFTAKLTKTNPMIDPTEKLIGFQVLHNAAFAYLFLVKHYNPGDSIFLFGSSSGAYAGRVLRNLLRTFGLLDRNSIALKNKYTKNGMLNLHQAIEDGIACYDPNINPDNNTNAQTFKNTYSHDATNIICFTGEWEPVKGFSLEHMPKNWPSENVSTHVRIALAIDEKRKELEPALSPLEDHEDTSIMYFSGTHVDVTGGCAQGELSHIPLRWMLDEANQCGLPLKIARISRLYSPNLSGTTHRSFSRPLWKNLCTKERRTIDLTSPQVYIHPSALERFGQEVPKVSKLGTTVCRPYIPLRLAMLINKNSTIVNDDFEKTNAATQKIKEKGIF